MAYGIYVYECSDINECVENPDACPSCMTCVNTPTSYLCVASPKCNEYEHTDLVTWHRDETDCEYVFAGKKNSTSSMTLIGVDTISAMKKGSIQ